MEDTVEQMARELRESNVDLNDDNAVIRVLIAAGHSDRHIAVLKELAITEVRYSWA